MIEEKEIILTANDLPITFQVKYLGNVFNFYK